MPGNKSLFSNNLAMKEPNSLGNYLGFPMISSRPSEKYFQFILDHMNTRLKSWETKLLSIAGRTTLIKSTIAAIPNHVMKIYNLHKITLDKIDSIQRNFLRGSIENK